MSETTTPAEGDQPSTSVRRRGGASTPTAPSEPPVEQQPGETPDPGDQNRNQAPDQVQETPAEPARDINQTMPESGFVQAYSLSTGAAQVIPEHWLDHEVLGKDFTTTPPDTSTPDAGEKE